MIVLQTDRLIIKEYKTEYVNLAHKVFSDPKTMAFWPAPFSINETQKWIERSMHSYKENGFGRYAIYLKETNHLIGDCGILKLETDNALVHDLGYIIHAPFWNSGLGVEASKAVMDYGFNELNIERLYANMPFNHAASIKVAEKLGMKQIKEFHNNKNRCILTYLYCSVKQKV